MKISRTGCMKSNLHVTTKNWIISTKWSKELQEYTTYLEIRSDENNGIIRPFTMVSGHGNTIYSSIHNAICNIREVRALLYNILSR